MKIEKIRLRKLSLNLKNPFRTGFGEINKKETLIVSIESNGVTGYGESSSLHAPIYNEESVDGCMLFIKKYIASQIIGKEIDTVADLQVVLDKYRGNSIAKAGIENAYVDLYSKLNKIPITSLIGGTKPQVQVGGNSIGIQNSIEEVLILVNKELDNGLDRMKVKIKPGWDIEVIEKIRSHFSDIEIMVDANSSYNIDSHKQRLIQLDKYNLTMIEQPFGANSIYSHALLQKEMKTPICLDESIKDIETANEAVSLGACKIVNIKQARVGGLFQAKNINDLLQLSGIKCWCGGMLETSIGRAHNILISSLQNFTYPADISPYDHYFEDIVEFEPFPVVKSYISIPSEPGIGFQPSESKINQYTIEEELFTST